jgi:hypothetical protein
LALFCFIFLLFFLLHVAELCGWRVIIYEYGLGPLNCLPQPRQRKFKHNWCQCLVSSIFQ